ncbi:MAG: hypothetical protein HC915_04465 [Anaerolineae bacterium]|nr:hypothetical protein [Anaerolineae bacterium]
MGAQVVRFFAAVNVDAQGKPRTDIPLAIERGKAVLDRLQQRGMFALLTLTDALWSGFSVRVEPRYRVDSGVDVLNLAWYAEGYQKSLLPFIQEYVGVLGAHPAVLGWGIGNAMRRHPSLSPVTPQECEIYLSFFRATSEAIRRHAPTKLITPGIESAWHLFGSYAYDGPRFGTRLYNIATLDLATLHTFQNPPGPTRQNLGHLHTHLERELQLAQTEWGVPVIVQEIGPTGGRDRGDGGAWISATLEQLFEMGISGALQYAFHAPPRRNRGGQPLRRDALSGQHPAQPRLAQPGGGL